MGEATTPPERGTNANIEQGISNIEHRSGMQNAGIQNAEIPMQEYLIQKYRIFSYETDWV
jgi:hypothetical protein